MGWCLRALQKKDAENEAFWCFFFFEQTVNNQSFILEKQTKIRVSFFFSEEERVSALARENEHTHKHKNIC